MSDRKPDPEGARAQNIDMRMKHERQALNAKQSRWTGKDGRLHGMVSGKAQAARSQAQADLRAKEHGLRAEHRRQALQRAQATRQTATRAPAGRGNAATKALERVQVRRQREVTRGNLRGSVELGRSTPAQAIARDQGNVRSLAAERRKHLDRGR